MRVSSPAGSRPGRWRATRCSRAATCRARPSPRSSRSTAIRRTSPPPSSPSCAARARISRSSTAARSRSSTAFMCPARMTCPGAELVHRFADLVPDRDTLVVVSCAGRTRSIIGAQSLINAGVPNKVVSLQGGTQGWRLAGLELERNTRQTVAPVSADAAQPPRPGTPPRSPSGTASSGSTARRLPNWQREAATRTTYLLDVRTPEEFAAGHLPGSVSAPGRAAGAGDRPLGRHARRPARAGRRQRHPRGDDRALAEADGLGRQRARPRLRRRRARTGAGPSVRPDSFLPQRSFRSRPRRR